jgi:hypothetical protein
MTIKRWELAGVRDVASVWETIRRVATSGRSDSPRTCWHAVGLYLHQHPGTVGTVWFYGPPGSEVNDPVSHVMLTDKAGKVLRDTLQSRGGHQLQNGGSYKSPDASDAMELMAWKKWL